VARVAAQRGARVSLIGANTEALNTPAGVDLVPVLDARQLREEVLGASAGADIVVMAAAVADFRPVAVARYKIKKEHGGGEPMSVPLTRNPDVLTELTSARAAGTPPVIVGFAAETGDGDGDVLAHGRTKLIRKGCDLLVVNTVGDDHAFGRPDNAGWLLERTGAQTALPLGPKSVLAAAVLDSAVRISRCEGGANDQR
jgi:phosphopantothenoylcysteine decarboxylase/phosphopantothenate--cysteine ligase